MELVSYLVFVLVLMKLYQRVIASITYERSLHCSGVDLSTKMEIQNSSLMCAICLECFNCPVTIPCGHTFCKNCINMHWDAKSKFNIGPQCPICNKNFSSRPILNRNTSLSVLTEAANSTASSCREPQVRAGEGGKAVRLCHRHKKPFVYYCRQDKMPVCCQCGIAECKTHETVMLEAERDNQEVCSPQAYVGSIFRTNINIH